MMGGAEPSAQWTDDAMLKVGDVAPEFTLADERGQRVALSSFRGKCPVVLVFYPGDSTPLCSAQLCEIRDSWDAFTVAGVQVFGINPFSEASHRRFAESRKLPFRLLVDPGNRVAALYRAAIGWGRLSFVNRCVYLIGADGRILFARIGKPAPAAVLAALAPAA